MPKIGSFSETYIWVSAFGHLNFCKSLTPRLFLNPLHELEKKSWRLENNCKQREASLEGSIEF